MPAFAGATGCPAFNCAPKSAAAARQPGGLAGDTISKPGQQAGQFDRDFGLCGHIFQFELDALSPDKGLVDACADLVGRPVLLLDGRGDIGCAARNPRYVVIDSRDRLGDIGGAALHVADVVANLGCCALSLRCQRLDLFGDHRKAAPGFARPGGLDQGVQREDIGLRRDRFDRRDDFADDVAAPGQGGGVLVRDTGRSFGRGGRADLARHFAADLADRAAHLAGRGRRGLHRCADEYRPATHGAGTRAGRFTGLGQPCGRTAKLRHDLAQSIDDRHHRRLEAGRVRRHRHPTRVFRLCPFALAALLLGADHAVLVLCRPRFLLAPALFERMKIDGGAGARGEQFGLAQKHRRKDTGEQDDRHEIERGRRDQGQKVERQACRHERHEQYGGVRHQREDQATRTDHRHRHAGDADPVPADRRGAYSGQDDEPCQADRDRIEQDRVARVARGFSISVWRSGRRAGRSWRPPE